MICKNNKCKAELPDDATFCLKCGTKQDISQPTQPTQSNCVDINPTSNNKKKSILITIVVLALIACIAIGAVILTPKIIEISSQTQTTIPTTTAPTEIHDYSIEICPIEVSDVTVSYDDTISKSYITAKWGYNPINSDLIVDKVIFNFTTYNEMGFDAPGRYTAKGPFLSGVSYEEKWQSAQGSIDSAEINEIEIYYTNNIIENYTVTEPETEVPTQPKTTKPEINKPRINTLENCPVKVNSYYTTKPNSADGVSFYIDWYSTDEEEIKYIYFTVTPYNRVDDEQKCEISGRSTMTGKITGPFYYGSADCSYWECAWYNSDIDYITLDKITIEYMDGTKSSYY